MTRAILQAQTNNLLTQHIDIDNPVQLSRLNQFDRWLDDNAQNIVSTNLADYRDYILYERQLSPASVSSHLSTLRGAYQRLLASNDLRDCLYSMTNKNDSTTDKQAVVDEMIECLKNASNSKNSRVSVIQKSITT